jgi:DNA-binding MarR family transcriptional regulator
MSSITQQEKASLDALELGAWRGLLRTHSSLVKALDAELEAAHGLPLTSYELLLHLGQAPEKRMRMCDLADLVLLSRSGLTRLIDRLEREGLVVRRTCEQDARGAFAELTATGSTRLAEAGRTHLDGVRRLFLSHFDASELATLAGFWDRVCPGAAAGGGDCGIEPQTDACG